MSADRRVGPCGVSRGRGTPGLRSSNAWQSERKAWPVDSGADARLLENNVSGRRPIQGGSLQGARQGSRGEGQGKAPLSVPPRMPSRRRVYGTAVACEARVKCLLRCAQGLGNAVYR